MTWTLWLTRKANIEMQKTTKLMRDEQRPWLDFEFIGFKSPFTEVVSKRAYLEIRFTNIGKSIATMGEVHVQLSASGYQGPNEIRNILKEKSTKSTLENGLSFIPNAPYVQAHNCKMPSFLICGAGSDPIKNATIYVNILISYRGLDKSEIFSTFKTFLITKGDKFTFYDGCDASSVLAASTYTEEEENQKEYN